MGAKQIFLENSALSRKTSYGFLAPYQNLEKINDTIKKNIQTDGQTEGQTDPISENPSSYRQRSKKQKAVQGILQHQKSKMQYSNSKILTFLSLYN